MGSLHAFYSLGFLKSQSSPSHRIPLKRRRLICTIGWKFKWAVGNRRRQQTLPFTGLIVFTISSTSYTTSEWQRRRKAHHKHWQTHAPLCKWIHVMRFYSNATIGIYTKRFTYENLLMVNTAIDPHTHTHFLCVGWMAALVAPQSF